MTIYSQHPHRGKVQLLATYRSPGGVASSTVTSVDSEELAAPIVDALNRISAYATVPVSVYDTREGPVGHYPTVHLASLTDPEARAELLTTSHSLWYAEVMWLLHEALTDLDAATASVPGPVRTAVSAELETEANWLRLALAEYTEGAEVPDDTARRLWEFEEPFITFNVDDPVTADQQVLDDFESSATSEEFQSAVDDLRRLFDAHSQCTEADARLLLERFEISMDPLDVELTDRRLYLNVEAPLPGGEYGRHGWRISLDRWITDEVDDEGYPTEEHGEGLLLCELSARPTITDIVALLDISRERLTAWADTPVGQPLEGTGFVVTERSEN